MKKTFNADLHFHGLYSGGVSKNMLLPVIAEQARYKGLDLCSTSDITFGKWLQHCREELVEESNGVFKHRKFDTYFVIGTEVECKDRIHHLVFLPDFAAAETFRESLMGKGNLDSYGMGRPKLRMSAQEVAESVVDASGIIGPAHAFTPYFSVYAHFDSVKGAYGSMGKEIGFIELGLSADTHYADMISENHNYQFITASDSHSPWPYRIGREFIKVELKEPSFKELCKALCERELAAIKLNVGLNPKEGKYHCTACNVCFEKYSLREARVLRFRCRRCRGTIKRGVRDRILMLADAAEGQHPEFRPKYLHAIPLAEIIQDALDVKAINSMGVQGLWREFVDRFGNEINALIDAPIEELGKVNAKVALKVNAFRHGWVHYIPGGGGNYGKPVICNSKEEFERREKELGEQLECSSASRGQSTLNEF